MMRNDPLPFNFVADNGEADETSAPVVTGHYWGHAIQIDGTFTADVTLEVRLSKSVNYVPVQTVAGPAIIPIGYPVESMRLVVANYVDGQVVGVYAGYKIR
jgi:hypothetical protein